MTRRPRALLAVLLGTMLLSVGCGSLTGDAHGTCRVRYGTRSPAVATEGGERTDTVELRVVDRGRDRVTMSFGGCRLNASAAPSQPSTNPHYLVDEGSVCVWDVPGLGSRRFPVANLAADSRATESTGHEAYANFAGPEIFVVLEAPVDAGEARFDCDFVRAP